MSHTHTHTCLYSLAVDQISLHAFLRVGGSAVGGCGRMRNGLKVLNLCRCECVARGSQQECAGSILSC